MQCARRRQWFSAANMRCREVDMDRRRSIRSRRCVLPKELGVGPQFRSLGVDERQLGLNARAGKVFPRRLVRRLVGEAIGQPRGDGELGAEYGESLRPTEDGDRRSETRRADEKKKGD